MTTWWCFCYFFPENRIWHFMKIVSNAKYIFIFSHKIGFDISCKLSSMETICMKCQTLFSGKHKKISYIKKSPTELAQRMVKVKYRRQRDSRCAFDPSVDLIFQWYSISNWKLKRLWLLGPVVQSIVSLMSFIVVKMLIVLVRISNSQIFLLKKCE